MVNVKRRKPYEAAAGVVGAAAPGPPYAAALTAPFASITNFFAAPLSNSW